MFLFDTFLQISLSQKGEQIAPKITDSFFFVVFVVSTKQSETVSCWNVCLQKAFFNPG